MVHLDAFLEQITEVEKESDVSDVLELLSWFENLALDEWESLLTYEDGAPGNTILYQSEKVKIVLIYWKGKQKSSVHGHPGGGGLLRVLSGSLEETRYTPDDSRTLIDKSRLEAGSLGYIHDVLAYHQVVNPEEDPAVSLHMYSLTSGLAQA